MAQMCLERCLLHGEKPPLRLALQGFPSKNIVDIYEFRTHLRKGYTELITSPDGRNGAIAHGRVMPGRLMQCVYYTAKSGARRPAR